MFAISDSTIAAVRHAFDESGELAAIAELRRHYSGIGDLATGRRIVRMILGWQPLANIRPTRLARMTVRKDPSG